MSRVKENQKMVDELMENPFWNDATLIGVMLDISKSLAVLADCKDRETSCDNRCCDLDK